MYEHIFAETPLERAGRYRKLARVAEESAELELLPAIRAAYLRSAERWNKLASIMELGIGHEPRKPNKADYGKQPKKARGWTIHKQQNATPHGAPRYLPEEQPKADDGEQGDPEIAASGGIGVRRAVLGRRGVLGRTASVPVRRIRSG